MQKLTKLLVFFSLLFCTHTWAAVGSVIVSWDANIEAALAGYRVFWGTETGNYTEVLDVGNVTEKVIPGFQEGETYYFAVVAYDGDGLPGPLSDEVFLKIKVTLDGDGNPIPQAPSAPRGLRKI